MKMNKLILSLTITLFLLRRLLISEDFPTFGLPQIASFKCLFSSSCSLRNTAFSIIFSFRRFKPLRCTHDIATGLSNPNLKNSTDSSSNLLLSALFAAKIIGFSTFLRIEATSSLSPSFTVHFSLQSVLVTREYHSAHKCKSEGKHD